MDIDKSATIRRPINPSLALGSDSFLAQAMKSEDHDSMTEILGLSGR